MLLSRVGGGVDGRGVAEVRPSGDRSDQPMLWRNAQAQRHLHHAILPSHVLWHLRPDAIGREFALLAPSWAFLTRLTNRLPLLQNSEHCRLCWCSIVAGFCSLARPWRAASPSVGSGSGHRSLALARHGRGAPELPRYSLCQAATQSLL